MRAEALAFENREAYVLRVERDARSAYHVEYRCFAVEREPPPDDWALLAGEAIQNLRSALEHVVYAAAVLSNDRSGFPILTNPDPKRWKSEAVRRLVKGVPAPVLAAIKRAQPYARLPAAPHRDPLEELRQLSNIDKHRTLTTVASAVHHRFIGIREGIETEWHDYAERTPLSQGETYIFGLTARSETKIEEADVNPQFTYEVLIEQRPITLLVTIAKRVFEVVTECETGQPISPFAAYPIY